jgi:hypothetical protein
MKNPPIDPGDDKDLEMREEYDFSGGVRGKYAERYAQGTNLVLLDPDVAKVFPDSAAVNDALRALVKIIRERSSAA